jgi:hypothetical protein
VAENSRPPVAIRIVRPYETEESFLENELETVGKTSVILIGAHSRPTGVILRFEVTLASGATVLRGEGRVLAHKENAFRGQAGLALRFTRLDPKSKALVDRAAAIREARLAGEASRHTSAEPPPPAPSSAPSAVAPHAPSSGSIAAASHAPAPGPSSPPPRDGSLPPAPGLAQMLTSPTPEPPVVDARRRSMPAGEHSYSSAPAGARSRSDRPTGAPPPSTSDAPLPAAEPLVVTDASDATDASATSDGPMPSAQAVTSLPAALDIPALEAAALEASAIEATDEVTSGAPSAPPPGSASPNPSAPSDRDALLSRLRQRARALTEEQKAAILRSS